MSPHRPQAEPSPKCVKNACGRAQPYRSRCSQRHSRGTCPDTGGQEGLTYVFQHTSDTFGDETSFHEAIYDGPVLVGPELTSAE